MYLALELVARRHTPVRFRVGNIQDSLIYFYQYIIFVHLVSFHFLFFFTPLFKSIHKSRWCLVDNHEHSNAQCTRQIKPCCVRGLEHCKP